MILDTNALSLAADGHPGVLAILAGIPVPAIPVVVIGEYQYGIARSRHRASYRRWLDSLIAECTVLDIIEETSHHYAAIRLELRDAGRLIPTNDIWIAALCRQHGQPLLSQDGHFDVVAGIRRLDW